MKAIHIRKEGQRAMFHLHTFSRSWDMELCTHILMSVLTLLYLLDVPKVGLHPLWEKVQQVDVWGFLSLSVRSSWRRKLKRMGLTSSKMNYMKKSWRLVIVKLLSDSVTVCWTVVSFFNFSYADSWKDRFTKLKRYNNIHVCPSTCM